MEELLLLGAGAVVLIIAAPIVGSLINPELGQTLSDSGRNLIKEGIKLGIDTTDKVQTSIAEAGESWNDLVAEAKAERSVSYNSSTPKNIEIVTE